MTDTPSPRTRHLDPRDLVARTRRRVRADRVARWVVTAGGLGIIASVLGILVFIVREALPLAQAAKVEDAGSVPVRGGGLGAMLVDEYRTLGAGLSAEGEFRVVDLATGAVRSSAPVLPEEPGVALRGIAAVPASSVLTATLDRGRVLLLPIDWRVDFEGDVRSVRAVSRAPLVFELDTGGSELGAYAANADEIGNATAAAIRSDGSLVVQRVTARENLMTGEVSRETSSFELESPRRPQRLIVAADGRNLFGGTADGHLLWWQLDGLNSSEAPLNGSQSEPPRIVPAGSSAITSLALLIGDRSLVVGTADGSLSVWFPVEAADGTRALTRIRDFPRFPGEITGIVPSMRNKGFLAAGGERLGLFHSTAGRTLWTGAAPLANASAMALSPRADGLFVSNGAAIARLNLDNPHPETTLGSLFGKVWYEGYEKPEYVWQSTGGTDDFEPKLSLTPLLVGTLKGTVYSLLLAIPLAVLGAMFVSQFLHASYQRFVKPTVEIMAALPTVVLGFLAGLWLAPRVERIFPGLLLMAVLVPIAVLLTGAAWSALPRAFRGRFKSGFEISLYAAAIVVAAGIAIGLNDPLQAAIFNGSFPNWLLEATGLAYDQRNAVVVGLAMGFAVIPIIFAISEDAFSNVPNNLISGSLALGANRWQTVTRVVLPTASPGIFSAVMVGFGRAVGETMIVLMATGNTPIMDWSPFNGFRTLSANIAVEIPEAPVGSTLYRTLFLAGLLLFVLTFAVNTVAEVVRQRLRRRYSQL